MPERGIALGHPIQPVHNHCNCHRPMLTVVAQRHGIGRRGGDGAPAGSNGGGISSGQRSAQRDGVGGEGLSQRLAVGGGKAAAKGQGGGHAVGNGHTVPCGTCGGLQGWCSRGSKSEEPELAWSAGVERAGLQSSFRGRCIIFHPTTGLRWQVSLPLAHIAHPTTPCTHLGQGNGGGVVAGSKGRGGGASNCHTAIGKGLGRGLSNGKAACKEVR